MFCKLNKLFQDPKIQYPLDNHSSFASYIDACKKLIANTRLDLNVHAEKIIEANAPFELYPDHTQKIKIGALLIHGLLECPFQMRDLGNYLQSQGTLVNAILLPGHGTIPGALLSVDYHQWIDTVRYAFNQLAKKVDRIFLIGNSTGASLSLYHVMHHEQVAGMILISPALKIKNPLAPLNNAHKLISWACERAAWFYTDSEETIDYVKYRSLPYNAVNQVYRLSEKIKNVHTSINANIPLFFVVSAEDAIINAKTVIQYFSAHQNQNSRLLLYSAQPIHFEDQRIMVRPGAFPAFKIIDMSHIALPIEPNNPHYGKNGDFIYASHVDHIKDNMDYGEFTGFQLKLNRFLHKYHLVNSSIQRLTFNPDFQFMAEQIGQFLNNNAL